MTSVTVNTAEAASFTNEKLTVDSLVKGFGVFWLKAITEFEFSLIPLTKSSFT